MFRPLFRRLKSSLRKRSRRIQYEKLALIVGATRFGGMENSSAIVFTSNLFNRDRRRDEQDVRSSF
jgi:hypothetical protein